MNLASLSLGASLLAVLLAGCSSTPVAGVVRSTPTAATTAKVTAAAAMPAGCHFQIAGIEDLRDQKDLGSLGPRVVQGQDFSEWFSDGLSRMPGYSKEPAPIQLHVQVLKAYMQGMNSLKSANLVVRARIEVPGHEAVSRNYRGVNDSMNWSSSETEIHRAFDRAMVDLTRHLQQDLRNACQS